MPLELRPIDRDAWRRWAPTFLDYNYRQLWEFASACAERVGAISEKVALYEGNEALALADVRIKKLPVVSTGIAYINGGPMVRRGAGEADEMRNLREMVERLIERYAKRRGLLLRVQPALETETWSDLCSQVFRDMGFFTGAGHPRPYRTMCLDLSPPLEDIRKSLLQKWRNGLNGAERQGLDLRVGTGASYFEEFLALDTALRRRKDFDTDLNAAFYAGVQTLLDEDERFVITLVDKDGAPVAGHVASLLGNRCVYLLGASAEAGLKHKAGYLAQWSVVGMAKARGCRWYDLGGIDPEGNPGVYRFKKGMGGIDVMAPGPFEYGPGALRSIAVRGAEWLYRKLKKRS